jgi:two-component system nitrogen regulation response regulator GlnG
LERARADGLPSKSLDTGAIDALRAYRWPGNVRELENVVRRLAALCPDEAIGGATIRAELAESEPAPAVPAGAGEVISSGSAEPLAQAVERHIRQVFAAHRDRPAPSDVYDRVLAEVERPLIQMTLAATRGNQIKAAAMLGLNRNTLRKKIRDLDIPVVRGIA